MFYKVKAHMGDADRNSREWPVAHKRARTGLRIISPRQNMVVGSVDNRKVRAKT